MTTPEEPTTPAGPRGSEGLTTRPPVAPPPTPVGPTDTAEPDVASAVETASAETTVAAAPEMAAPEVAVPEVAVPDTAGPETAEPETAEPEIAPPSDDLAYRSMDEQLAAPAPVHPEASAPDPVVAADYPLPDAAPAEPEDHLVYGDAPTAPARRSRAWLPLTAVGLAVALLAGGTAALAWELRQQDRADEAAVDAVAAARDAARLLFSYDHKTLQADFDKGLAVTTGDFRAQYQRTTKDVVSPVAVQYKAVVKAEVVEAAVIDAQADEVTALVFLNQATTSTRVQGQQVDQSRVRLRLVPRGGRWLVEEVKAL